MSNYSPKSTGHLKPRKTILLMVEGKSEEVYFTRLSRLSDKYSIKTKISRDKGCLDIIRACSKEADRIGLEEDDIKVVVFDLDVVDESELNEAVRLSREEDVILMTSNLSFEIWLLMHFESASRVYSQDDYENRLSRLLNQEYKKSSGIGTNVNPKSVHDAIMRGSSSLKEPDPIKCKNSPNTSTLWSLVSDIMGDKERK